MNRSVSIVPLSFSSMSCLNWKNLWNLISQHFTAEPWHCGDGVVAVIGSGKERRGIQIFSDNISVKWTAELLSFSQAVACCDCDDSDKFTQQSRDPCAKANF